MGHGIRLEVAEQAREGGRVAEVGGVRRRPGVGGALAARADQGVDLVSPRRAVGDEVAAGEPGGAGDEQPHEVVRLATRA